MGSSHRLRHSVSRQWSWPCSSWALLRFPKRPNRSPRDLHLSLRVGPMSCPCRRRSLPGRFDVRAPLLRFCAPPAFQPAKYGSSPEPKLRRSWACLPSPFRPRRFHDLDGLLLRCLRRGFPRAPLMGFRPSGSLPSLQRSLVSELAPFVSFAPRSRRKRGLASCALRRLQG